MRKYKFKQVENYIELFRKINNAVYQLLAEGDVQKACEYLELCQQKAIELGNFIESEESEGHPTVKQLEDFCEILFQVHEDLLSERGLSKESAKVRIDHAINEAEKSTKSDIIIQRLWVFLPYKAAMWDSLESIWLAAAADENCNAIVIPIPYYDRDTNGEFIREHYEADLFPKDVPLTRYDEFDFGKEHPDVIFVHNPYDKYNYVTSVHPFFYSDRLKNVAECLVYVPYFATAGGMGEAQQYMPSYDVFDYIVVQSEDTIQYYKNVPREKFLPLGSPKFDAIIKKCENPPEPPADWKKKMEGKKVYFYNTSLSGMLQDPKAFMEKMCYVFNTFKDRDDACLLWRPHPLFESTLASMEPQFLPIYHDIRDKYIAENWGIYDTTPSIEDTIALSDVYIGDSGTSVTSLFGVVGKPMFILNNQIHELPDEDDWKVGYYQSYFYDCEYNTYNNYFVSATNELYYSPNDDMHFEFYCRLSDYTSGAYYQRAIEYRGRIFVFPSNAEDILVIDKNKNIMKVELEHHVARTGAFMGINIDKNYVFLWPNMYGSLVRFDMDTYETSYLTNVSDFNTYLTKDHERITCARWYDKDNYYVLSGNGERLLTINKCTMETEIKETGFSGVYTTARKVDFDVDEVWLLPLDGTVVKYYNHKTKEKKDFDIRIDGIEGYDRISKVKNDRRLFSGMIFYNDDIIFSPYWGNKFVTLNSVSGEVKEWSSPFEIKVTDKNSYVKNYGVGYFLRKLPEGRDANYYYDYINRKEYKIDVESKEITPVEQYFDKDEIFANAAGYGNASHIQRYCCEETIYNTLKDLLDGNIHGHQHDKQEQLKEYCMINASPAGDCGEKVYEYLK